MSTAEVGSLRKGAKIRLGARHLEELTSLLRRAAKGPQHLEGPQTLEGGEPQPLPQTKTVEQQWLSSMVQHALIQLQAHVEPDDTDSEAFRAQVIQQAAANRVRDSQIKELKEEIKRRDKALVEAQAKAVQAVDSDSRRRIQALEQEEKQVKEMEVEFIRKGPGNAECEKERETRRKEFEAFATERAVKVADDMAQTLHLLKGFTCNFEKIIDVVESYMHKEPAKLDMIMSGWREREREQKKRKGKENEVQDDGDTNPHKKSKASHADLRGVEQGDGTNVVVQYLEGRS